MTVPALIGSADLSLADIPPLQYLVDDLVPEGLTLLVGKPKLGKSWLALHMAVEVALGGKVLNQLQTQQAEVLYIGLEDGQRRFQQRQLATYRGRQPTNALKFLTDLERMGEGGLPQLRALLDRLPATRFVIIDTWGRFAPKVQAKGNTYSADYDDMAQVQQLARDRRIAVIVVHHERKNQPEPDAYMLDSVLGSTALAGAADSILIMRQEGHDGRVLHLSSRDTDSRQINFRCDPTDGLWQMLRLPAFSPECQETLDALQLAREATIDDLSLRLKKSKQNIRRHIRVLVEAGQVIGSGGHAYRPAHPASL